MNTTEKLKIEYNPKIEGSGYYRCNTCNGTFHGGGHALHKKGCIVDTINDSIIHSKYNGCTYLFGPKEIDTLKDRGATLSGPSGLTLEVLKELYPDLV